MQSQDNEELFRSTVNRLRELTMELDRLAALTGDAQPFEEDAEGVLRTRPDHITETGDVSETFVQEVGRFEDLLAAKQTVYDEAIRACEPLWQDGSYDALAAASTEADADWWLPDIIFARALGELQERSEGGDE